MNKKGEKGGMIKWLPGRSSEAGGLNPGIAVYNPVHSTTPQSTPLDSPIWGIMNKSCAELRKFTGCGG